MILVAQKEEKQGLNLKSGRTVDLCTLIGSFDLSGACSTAIAEHPILMYGIFETPLTCGDALSSFHLLNSSGCNW
jgi:hypothetical protein